MITITIKVNDEEYEIEWKPETVTLEDIDTLSRTVKRQLRKALGHPPSNFVPVAT